MASNPSSLAIGGERVSGSQVRDQNGTTHSFKLLFEFKAK